MKEAVHFAFKIMSLQGRTAQIRGPFEVPDCPGLSVFFKKNPTEKITDIEYRVYEALANDPFLKENNVYVPYVERMDADVLAIEDCGTSLAYRLHFMHDSEEGTENILKPLCGGREETFRELLDATVKTSGRVNDIITATLTEEDKIFLQTQQLENLYASMKKKSDSEDITKEDIQKNFWAYRAMNALDFYDAEFKTAYTELIGAKIEAMLPEYGSYLGDNCLRNAVSPDGKTIVPIDFNSIHYGPKQMDDAGIIGLYIFGGPLGTHSTTEKRETLIDDLRKNQFPNIDSKEYLEAFILSSFHRNVLLAGYRTQEMSERFKEFENLCNAGKGLRLPIYREFRTAFDEVEYQNSVAVEAVRAYPELFAKNTEEKSKLRKIVEEINERTFNKRIIYFMNPLMQQADSFLNFLYYGPESRGNAHLNKSDELS